MHEPDESEVRRLVREAVDRALGPAPRAAGPAAAAPRRVAIGADHGGFALKEVLRGYIADELGWEVRDCGTHSTDAVDYPDFAAAVAREVAAGRCALGIVVDAAGIGSAMAANKVAGVRCAVCHDDRTVTNSREHNDANVLSLGARRREPRARPAARPPVPDHPVRRRPPRAPGAEDHGAGTRPRPVAPATTRPRTLREDHANHAASHPPAAQDRPALPPGRLPAPAHRARAGEGPGGEAPDPGPGEADAGAQGRASARGTSATTWASSTSR